MARRNDLPQPSAQRSPRGQRKEPRLDHGVLAEPINMDFAPHVPGELPCSFAGLALFAKYLWTVGIDRQLEERFISLKDEEKTTFPMDCVLRMLVDMFAAGASRVFDLEALAGDSLFVKLAGGVLPSLDTVYRDIARFDDAHVRSLSSMLTQHGMMSVRELWGTDVVHIDIDTTVIPVFGEQQCARKGYNRLFPGRNSYHPIVARCAETGTWIRYEFRPGDTGFGATDVPIIYGCIDDVRDAVGPNTPTCVRIDCAGDCAAIMHAIHKHKAVFVTKLKGTLELPKAAASHDVKWSTVDMGADNEPLVEVAELAFRRESCRRSQIYRCA